jgi:hypothetical protein
MVSVLASSVVDHRFESQWGQIKYYANQLVLSPVYPKAGPAYNDIKSFVISV